MSFLGFTSYSQSTYTLIYNLFQTQCTAGCHSGATPAGQLDFSASQSAVYNSIINKNPVNIAAAEKGDKLIAPGYPSRSFLLRKCANGLASDLALDDSEGEAEPRNMSPLRSNDIELIRQWILSGAPQNGNVVDTLLIHTFYSGKGVVSPPTALPAPTVAGAFQMHVGKIFVAPAGEYQFYLKQDPRLPDTVEVYRIDALLGKGGHHFNLLKFNPGAASLFSDGFRDLLGTSHLSATVVGAFQESYNLELPEGTAYQWEGGLMLDMNFHIINTNPDSY